MGALLVALLALATELLLGLVQRALTPKGLRAERRSRRAAELAPDDGPPSPTAPLDEPALAGATASP